MGEDRNDDQTNKEMQYFTPQIFFNYEPPRQEVYVNVKQYAAIRKRKARRDYLDSLMEIQKSSYLHESRHRHAMNRLRAPSGRFLTKEEMAMMRNKKDKSDGNS
ncbi:nuclear transcription factor Y subunit [Tubulinosema ratisbonensis]|uniref:Transcriptional activator HAP2 n=1 Tax=Tubulinosema ratisbonensis TaxID=291195 RepID=A0A437AIX2_9MICR|nr:nuclear transcription factor Y subunit [Tubulinosema ratisbonensis]